MSLWSALFGGGKASAEQRAHAHELVASGATLLDVRTAAEFRMGHIDGARNIPLAELPGKLESIDPKQAVVLYCRSGARSAQAARLLKQRGFPEVVDIGPMSAW